MKAFTLATIIVAIVLHQVALAADGSTDWSYDDQLSWPGVCVDGKSQSPISIRTAAIDQSVIINDLTINHDVAHNVTISFINNGFSAILDPAQYGLNVTHVRGYEGDHFLLQNVHAHWGLNNYTGSEHLIEGKAYPLEMHFVHYNDKFNSLGEAKGQPGGLAVIGVLFEIGEANSEIAKFLDSILAGRNTVDSVDLTALMPVDASTMFYAYNGSLTTPTCDENLLWHVAKTTMTVSEEQLQVLRNLVGPSGELIAPNHRDVQPLNDRRSHVKFDAIFGPDTSNEEVSAILLPELSICGAVEGDGPKVLLMAYGHTGSGKTHSIFGGDNRHNPHDRGLTGAVLEAAVDHCQTRECSLSISMMEIYKEKVYDLISSSPSSPLSVRCGAPVDAARVEIEDVYQALQTVDQGLANRAVDRNAMNHRSSRSHTLLVMYIDDVQRITIVDLAGSERWCRFGPLSHDKRRESRDEMASINKSLTALSMCVMNMAKKVPINPTFRASVLTTLLSTYFTTAPSSIHVLVCVASDTVGHSASDMARQTLLTDTQRSVQFACTMKKTVTYIKADKGSATEVVSKRAGRRRSQSLPPGPARPQSTVSRQEHEDLKHTVACLKSELDREKEMRLKLETMMRVTQKHSHDRRPGGMPQYASSQAYSSPTSLRTTSSVTTMSDKTSAPPSATSDCPAWQWTATGRPQKEDARSSGIPWMTPSGHLRQRDHPRNGSRLRRRSKPLSECTSSAPFSAPSENSVGLQSVSPCTIRTLNIKEHPTVRTIHHTPTRSNGYGTINRNEVENVKIERLHASETTTRYNNCWFPKPGDQTADMPSEARCENSNKTNRPYRLDGLANTWVSPSPSSNNSEVGVAAAVSHRMQVESPRKCSDSRDRRWDEILERCWRAPRRLTSPSDQGG
ncbi:hypothetical protein FOL47_007845 [Perkinsus chesapeaki]|uniref:Carbonic anhydrase n=1 Tax=Perkinsus chesapeaki TaxID=330153 RepID=A0A7J6MVN8_PERCH|nr:hypothetical protein FOL47_007845 [Perkinsus chesapeaki]